MLKTAGVWAQSGGNAKCAWRRAHAAGNARNAGVVAAVAAAVAAAAVAGLMPHDDAGEGAGRVRS